MRFLNFIAGEQRYALPVQDIIRIIPFVALLSLPNSPKEVLGLMAYHDSNVPVLDLGILLAHKPVPELISTRIAIIKYDSKQHKSQLLGLAAASMTSIIETDTQAFAPIGIELKQAIWLDGVMHYKNTMVQRVNIQKLLQQCLCSGLL